ncbi:MAG: DNA repair protein RecO [Magnetococcales bacterium]|nr:DNA repair protein RecO [Magnetococcales bacterium]
MGTRLRDLGLVLQRTAFRESSLVVRLLTRAHGQQAFMARGIRQDNRNGRRAALSGFHTIEIEGSSRSPNAMLLMTRVEMVRARHHLTQNPQAILAAQMLQETLLRLAADADPCEELFDATSAFFDLLDSGAPALIGLSVCLGRIMHLSGYGWRLDQCAGCGRNDDLAFFSIKYQQPVCTVCGTPHAQRLFPLTADVSQIMQHLPWPPDPRNLSNENANLFYRIVVNCLGRLTGGPLLTDNPFRAMMAIS